MFRKREKKKNSFGRFLGDAFTLVAAAGVCAVSYVVDKVSDVV